MDRGRFLLYFNQQGSMAKITYRRGIRRSVTWPQLLRMNANMGRGRFLLYCSRQGSMATIT
jgi:hypothetical protein